MGAVNWERWALGAGIGFVVLTVASFIVGGDTPSVTDSTSELISYYDGDRGQVLVSSFLFGLALLLFVWFAAAIANLLRAGGETRVAATVLAAVTAFVTVQLALTGVAASLAYSIAGQGDEGVVKALFDMQWVMDLFAGFPSAGFFLAASIGLARIGAIPTWLSSAGLAVSALFLLRTTNWASEGFWSPTGGYLFILIPVALLWILTTSIVLVRTASTEQTGAARLAS